MPTVLGLFLPRLRMLAFTWTRRINTAVRVETGLRDRDTTQDKPARSPPHQCSLLETATLASGTLGAAGLCDRSPSCGLDDTPGPLTEKGWRRRSPECGCEQDSGGAILLAQISTPGLVGTLARIPSETPLTHILSTSWSQLADLVSSHGHPMPAPGFCVTWPKT